MNFSSTGLAEHESTGTGLPGDANIDAHDHAARSRADHVRSQASEFGSNLSTVQIRQEFTKR